jgi:hypothetical protein
MGFNILNIEWKIIIMLIIVQNKISIFKTIIFFHGYLYFFLT